MTCKPYDLDLITALSNASKQECIEYFESMFAKNIGFFKLESSSICELLKNSDHQDFEINMTEDFFDIVDTKTGQCIHPEGDLLEYATQLGQWMHEGWVDLLNFDLSISEHSDYLHNKVCLEVESKLKQQFPTLPNANVLKRVNMKVFGENQEFRYSPAVFFIGISHGLHIIEYLRKTTLSHVVLFEPDPRKFILSCYFLDYEQIKQNSTKYYISIGEDNFTFVSKLLFQDKQISPFTWTRVLASEEIDGYANKIAKLKSFQMSTNELFFPIDTEIKSYKSAARFLQEKVPLLSKKPRVTQTDVVIVGAGPSLEEDLSWLQTNQSELIIFATLSVVKALVEHNIKVDFIFTLDSIVNTDDLKTTFALPSDTPIIGIYHTAQEFGQLANDLMICGSERETNLVKFNEPVKFFGASTINFILGFAMLCEPENIYLAGCDCAFSPEEKLNVSGSAHNVNNNRKFHEESTLLFVNGNMNKNTPVRTNVRLNDVAMSIDLMLSQYPCKSNVYNLSRTGAAIGHTTPLLSSDIIINKHTSKTDDIVSIHKAFKPAEKGENWQSFDVPGRVSLENYKTQLISAMNIDFHTWDEAVASVDGVTYNIFEKIKNKDSSLMDGRLGCYRSLFSVLCRFILNSMLTLDIFSEVQQIYRAFVAIFAETISKINWPTELEEF